MVQLKNVSKVYDNGTVALKDISLSIGKGEFVFIVGASGAGKSTFLKMIIAEEKPTSGEVLVNDYSINKIKRREIPYLRRTMGIVFQDFRLINKMTVYENVAFVMRVTGASPKSIKKRVPYVLGLVGLLHKAKCKPNELSGGEQQRVGLARALVNNPSMIVADEPTGNIDPKLTYEIIELLSEINRRGTTVVMVTHEHELIRQFRHRVVVIDDGYLIADDENNSVPDDTPEFYDYTAEYKYSMNKFGPDSIADSGKEGDR
ncbi:MAG: cell division ATP-binding protein FtsE [Clostridia bacterium]|nr:cell division ATP-binding protein FtsE [Clostridia bacterium]